MDLSAQGQTDLVIAEALGISQGTVNTYWGRIRAKLGHRSRPELIAVWIRQQVQCEVADCLAQKVELEEKLRRALTEQAELQALYEVSSFGVLLVGADGIILTANPAAEALTGRERMALVGHPLALLVPERRKVAHLERFQALLSAGRLCGPIHSIVSTIITEPSGREVAFSITITCFAYGGDVIVSLVLEPLRADALTIVEPGSLLDPELQMHIDAATLRDAAQAGRADLASARRA